MHLIKEHLIDIDSDAKKDKSRELLENCCLGTEGTFSKFCMMFIEILFYGSVKIWNHFQTWKTVAAEISFKRTVGLTYLIDPLLQKPLMSTCIKHYVSLLLKTWRLSTLQH